MWRGATRYTVPSQVRPVRPLRWIEELLEIQSIWVVSVEESGFHETTSVRQESITTEQPLMVMELSAIPVASMTLRILTILVDRFKDAKQSSKKGYV